MFNNGLSWKFNFINIWLTQISKKVNLIYLYTTCLCRVMCCLFPLPVSFGVKEEISLSV